MLAAVAPKPEFRWCPADATKKKAHSGGHAYARANLVASNHCSNDVAPGLAALGFRTGKCHRQADRAGVKKRGLVHVVGFECMSGGAVGECGLRRRSAESAAEYGRSRCAAFVLDHVDQQACPRQRRISSALR